MEFRVAGQVGEFVADVSRRYRVRDLVVEHPPIEEIVADLYRAQGRAPRAAERR